MAISFISNSSAAGTGVTTLTTAQPAGMLAGDMLVCVYAFEGVAANSGPWIIPNTGQFAGNNVGPFGGYAQVCWSGPNAAGVGVEVWVAIISSPATTVANFAASQNVVGVVGCYRGEYNPTGNILGGPPRVATVAQVVGNAPAAPSVVPNVGELVVACAGDTMGAGGFGTPSGFTNRVDVRRAAAGTVEATIADATATLAAATGPITFPNAASSGTAAGVTATLIIRPVPTTPGVGGLMDAPMPEDLVIAEGYKIRVSALDPLTGASVSGVNIGETVLTADSADTGIVITQGDGGSWLLVPGPNA